MTRKRRPLVEQWISIENKRRRDSQTLEQYASIGYHPMYFVSTLKKDIATFEEEQNKLERQMDDGDKSIVILYKLKNL